MFYLYQQRWASATHRMELAGKHETKEERCSAASRLSVWNNLHTTVLSTPTTPR